MSSGNPPVARLLLGVFLGSLLLGGLTGCMNKLFRHSGAVNMTGDMKVRGEMDMGEIDTTIRLRNDGRTSPLEPVVVSGDVTASGKVAIVDVDDFLVDHAAGGLGTAGENPVALFREKIHAIQRDPSVKAVVVRINSPGGGVTATDMMAHELAGLKQARGIPIVACVLDVGTGGGYYLANEADSIIAHPTSIIGGVGVILNVYNLEDTMGQFNILATPVKSGDRIDAGTPIRPLEDAELDMLQQIAESFHERFIGRVVERRPQLDPLRKRWTSGDVMTGSEANDLGLVDAIGYLDDAINAARQQAGLKEDSAVILYRRNNDSAYTSLDVSPNQPLLPPLLPVRLPGLDRSTMPTFLYLWQPDPAMASQVGR